MKNQSVAALLLHDASPTLPANRQCSIAIRKLELQLKPYPAYFRELKEQVLLEIRVSHPEAAEDIEAALDATQQAIELHLAGLQCVNKMLNNQQ